VSVRHQVPQYLEVEDRIFGPLTLKQFVFVAGGAGGAYLTWAMMPSPWNYAVAALIAICAAALAFGNTNGRPFLITLEAAARYAVSRKFYLWRRAPKSPDTSAAEAAALVGGSPLVPRLSDSKLKTLAWGLDIHEALSAGNLPRSAELARPSRLRDPLAE